MKGRTGPSCGLASVEDGNATPVDNRLSTGFLLPKLRHYLTPGSAKVTAEGFAAAKSIFNAIRRLDTDNREQSDPKLRRTHGQSSECLTSYSYTVPCGLCDWD